MLMAVLPNLAYRFGVQKFGELGSRRFEKRGRGEARRAASAVIADQGSTGHGLPGTGY